MDDRYRLSYEEFCRHLGSAPPAAALVGDRYYIEGDDLKGFTTGEQRKPYMRGLSLGMKTPQGFVPSPALLTLLAKESKHKALVHDEHTERLFLCGRDLFPEKFTSTLSEGFVLVQNARDENLGLGELQRTQRGLEVRNILDRGNYLRHDRVQLAPKAARKKSFGKKR
jgi:ribosome biogenesis protein Nip4